jgi:hypothetical protein
MGGRAWMEQLLTSARSETRAWASNTIQIINQVIRGPDVARQNTFADTGQYCTMVAERDAAFRERDLAKTTLRQIEEGQHTALTSNMPIKTDFHGITSTASSASRLVMPQVVTLLASLKPLVNSLQSGRADVPSAAADVLVKVDQIIAEMARLENELLALPDTDAREHVSNARVGVETLRKEISSLQQDHGHVANRLGETPTINLNHNGDVSDEDMALVELAEVLRGVMAAAAS